MGGSLQIWFRTESVKVHVNRIGLERAAGPLSPLVANCEIPFYSCLPPKQKSILAVHVLKTNVYAAI